MKLLAINLIKLVDVMSSTLSPLQPVLSVAGRIYVSWVFFASGLTKIADWESTLFLFEYEYQVPLLNFVLAAYLATIAELLAPVLLFFGFASRLSAIVLGVVNVVAVISLEEIAPAALYGHVIWGLILLHVTFWGAGKLSGDHLLRKQLTNFLPARQA
ncbi:DoxX family protein [Alteromonas sediminis]|uniref:DoxX family protein n=1 Tax=Alteromonas sediminis TaxID=2259342 RepID=A0A3N5ZAL9_9ALTE|nr:DoxX family protein [Alteromonas sediminis]RPJ66548.1 DoxX family protein [Alteromonas sediminis]